jgi:hypothetical protein
MRLPSDRIQRGRSGAIEPSKNALLTIDTRGKLLSIAAVIRKCDNVSIFGAQPKQG